MNFEIVEIGNIAEIVEEKIRRGNIVFCCLVMKYLMLDTINDEKIHTFVKGRICIPSLIITAFVYKGLSIIFLEL